MNRAAKNAIAKLSPKSISYSNKMCAIVGYIVGERWTRPMITSMRVTSDGFVLAGDEDAPMYNYAPLGTVADLRVNWARLHSLADLNDAEIREANRMFLQRVGTCPAWCPLS